MKKLNKKVSIGVLIAFLSIGGSAFLGIRLAHADWVNLQEQVGDDLLQEI